MFLIISSRGLSILACSSSGLSCGIKWGKDGTETPGMVTQGMRFQNTEGKSTLGFNGAWNSNPLFGRIGDEIFKKQEKKVHWVSTGHETQFRNKFGAQLSLPCPCFTERIQPITAAAAMFAVAVNVLKPRACNPESQYFIPLFNKISWLCAQEPGADEASNEGCTQAQQGMTLRITLVLSSCFETLSTTLPPRPPSSSVSRLLPHAFSTLHASA